MIEPTIGWSNFALKNSVKGTGQSYSILPPDQIALLVQKNWHHRKPGDGEGDSVDRKVLVPIVAVGSLFFCPPKVKLVEGMPVQARVAVRAGQENTEELPTIETWIDFNDAKSYDLVETPANHVDVVCYSAEALMENGGTRSTNCEWEIVAILASTDANEPMNPITMARNFLGAPGGTKSTYTAEEFAKAILFHANQGLKVKISASV